MDSSGLGFRRGVNVFLQLSYIMIPVYILTAVLKLTPALDYISGLFEPLMEHIGLPGSSAIALVTGTFVNLYAAAAIVAGLDMTSRQLTILALMLGFSHSQIMETAIIGKMKARPFYVTPLRVLFGLFSGFVLHSILP
ncbi:MAG: nucleoside recognition protein [Candidatus Zixiibacteriota bacterium]|nr:MAG: nucleoside recognition protein [candidate division Zixibacteria bacterium]